MITIRDALPGDRPLLVDWMAALNAFEHRLEADRDLGRDAADRHLAHLETLVRDQDGFLLVALDDGAPLGFLVGIVEREDGSYVVPEARAYGCVTDVFVAAPARGRGAGRALVAEAERRFRLEGLGSVRMTALAANAAARDAYRALGYRPLYETYVKPLARDAGTAQGDLA